MGIHGVRKFVDNAYEKYKSLTPQQKALIMSTAKYAGNKALEHMNKPRTDSKPHKHPQKPKTRVLAKSNLVATDIHSGITEKHMKVVFNGKRSKSVGGAPITYYESFAGISVAPGSGYQSCDSIIYGSTISQWQYNQPNNTVPTQSVTRYFDLNPVQSLPATTLYGVAKLTPMMDRLCLMYCTYYMDFSNFTNVQTTLDVYILKSKRTHAFAPDVAWGVGLNQEANGFAGGAPVPASGAATATLAMSKYQPFMTPKSKVFSENWSIKKVHRILMAGGATETLCVDVVHNYIGKQEYFNALPITSGYVAGTLAVMIVAKGSPMHIVGSNECTLSAASIGYTIAKKSVFKPVLGNAARIRIEVGNEGIPNNIPAASLQIINNVDSAVTLSTA